MMPLARGLRTPIGLAAVSPAEPMSGSVVLDAAGRRRSPATMPGFHAGHPPRNKGLRYPADPPTVDEIVAVMRIAGDGPHGRRLHGLIVVLWRAGLRIDEALALREADLDRRRGSILVRRGKGGRRREIGMDDWGWQELEPRLVRASLCPSVHCSSASSTDAPAGARGRPAVHAPSCDAPPPGRACADASPLTSCATRTRSRWPAKASRSSSSNASSGTATSESPRWVGTRRGDGVTAGPFPRPALRTGRARSRASGSPQDVRWPLVTLAQATADPGRVVARAVPGGAHGEGIVWPR